MYKNYVKVLLHFLEPHEVKLLQTRYLHFFIDIPFKGCQGRSNRSSIVHACIVQAVSMTPPALCMLCH
jgi:hypothetical protein